MCHYCGDHLCKNGEICHNSSKYETAKKVNQFNQNFSGFNNNSLSKNSNPNSNTNNPLFTSGNQFNQNFSGFNNNSLSKNSNPNSNTNNPLFTSGNPLNQNIDSIPGKYKKSKGSDTDKSSLKMEITKFSFMTNCMYDCVYQIINSNRDKIKYFFTRKGGWEIWLQSEIMYYLENPQNNIFISDMVDSESNIFLNEEQACDFTFIDKLEDTHNFIELKTQTSTQKNVISRMYKDINKLNKGVWVSRKNFFGICIGIGSQNYNDIDRNGSYVYKNYTFFKMEIDNDLYIYFAVQFRS